MLSQIREVSGIDGSTLQNWTKRGWVENARLKKYNIDQVAHILIINMLRSCIQLDKIAFLLHYINGRVDDRSDDIIRDSVLYDYICRILEKLMEQRKNYLYQPGEPRIPAAEGLDKYHLGAASPILSQGDLMGCVLLLLGEGDVALQESDQGLVRTAAGFLGKQMES